MKPDSSICFSKGRHGFSRVVTLSLMILLTVIAVRLLSLSSISLRSSSAEQLNQQARQNARFALMLAIGELQVPTGADQRVTAPARIWGADLSPQHPTGVWLGWKWDGKGSPDFEVRKKSQFLRWLVSSRDLTATTSLDFAKTGPPGNVATLVRGNRDPSDGDGVDAQIVPVVFGKNNLRHGFAWAVFDESTKLPIALPEPDEKSVTADVERMSAAPLPGYTAATKRNWSSLKLLADQRSKHITPHHSGLANLASADRSFHDLANCFLAGSAFTGRKNTFYRLNLLPEKRADEIFMASGEHLVLTASNHTQSFINKFSSEGIDQKEPWSHHQYGLQWEAMTDWPPASPTIKISNANNREYGGPEIYAHSGLEFATHTSIRSGEGDRTLLDHSYYANSALFDPYFFSILAEPGEPLGRKSTVKDAISGLFDKGTPLANPRFIRHRGGLDTQEITAALAAVQHTLQQAL